MYNNKGFTLIELMVTVMITAILATIALPASRDFQASMRVNSMASEYASFLREARALAIRNNRNVEVKTLNSSPIASNNWGADGWQANEIINGASRAFKEFRGVPKNSQIYTITSQTDSFRFISGTGLVQNAVIIRICDYASSNERGYDIQVNQLGRISMTRHVSPITCG